MDKLIGIVLSKQGEKTYGLNNAYKDYFDQFGDLIFIDATSDRVFENLDLLVLPGGADVYPLRYGQKPGRFTGKPNIDFEYFDTYILPRYINETNIPIMGICRGAQTLNVTYGGQLTQHINQAYSANRYELVDEVIVSDSLGSLLDLEQFDLEKFKINSIHHQGWFMNQVADGFEPMLVNKTFNNVEGMYHAERNIWAVQYHPEEINCPLSSLMIEKLLTNG